MLAFNVYSLFIKFNASALVVGLFITVDIEFNNPVTLFNPFVKEAVFFNMEFSNVNVVEEASFNDISNPIVFKFTFELYSITSLDQSSNETSFITTLFNTGFL